MTVTVTYPSPPSNDQINLSERLQLLHELGHSYPVYGVRRSQANLDIRFLDTIALALTTGKPGEFFAAALDTREHIQRRMESPLLRM